MAKKKDSVKQPSLKDQLAASRRINDNIAGRVREEEEEQEEEEEGIVPENMTMAELKAALDEAGVEYKSDDKKADLVQLYSDWLADQQGEEEEEEQE